MKAALSSLVGQLRPGEPDVVRDRRVEQEPVLRHHHHPASAASRTGRRSAAPRTAAPRRPIGSISRVSSLANVVLPLPVSPTTATRLFAGIVQVDVVQHSADRPGRRTARRRTGRPAARPAGPARARPGRPRPGRRPSTSSTRRQPAIAFCASLSTSVAICTGWMNSVTRNRNAVSWPIVSVPSTPSSTPTHHHAGQRQPGRQLADRAAHDAGPERPLLRQPLPVDRRRRAAARCGPATPYARITGAPTTLSPIAPSIVAGALPHRRVRAGRAGAGTAGSTNTSRQERGAAPPASAARSRPASRRW